jgi:hypothetical protein
MTHKKAKKLCLEVWRYLAEHPETAHKEDLPEALYRKIKDLRGRCPLCEVCFLACCACPLGGRDYSCLSSGQPYSRWDRSRTPGTRRKAAEEIVQRVEAWEVEA